MVKNEVYSWEKLKEAVSKEVVKKEPREKDVSENEEEGTANEPSDAEKVGFAAIAGAGACSSVSGRSTPNISASWRDTFRERSICSTFSAVSCSPQSLSQRERPPPRQ